MFSLPILAVISNVQHVEAGLLDLVLYGFGAVVLYFVITLED